MPEGASSTDSQAESKNPSQADSIAGPEAEYRVRLSVLAREESAFSASDRRYVGAKIAVFAIGALLAAWLMKYAPGRLPLLAIVLAIFALTFVLHERVLRSLRRTRQRINFYQRGLARLEGRWPGTGRQGDQFLEAAHPYARDLDLFGKGGLFELLCTARTSAGEQMLAAWLLAAAPVEEIAQRQAAVAELAPRLDFQERMALAGEDIQAEGAHTPETLTAWAESEPKPKGPSGHAAIRLLALALAACWMISVLLWFLSRLNAIPLWQWGAVAIGFSVANLALNSTWRKQVAAASRDLEAAGRELPLLAAVFNAIEQENFTSPKLAALQSALQSSGVPPSRAIAKLNGYRENLMNAHNVLMKVADPFIFWTRQWVWSTERWRSRHGSSVREWMNAAAEIEALLALALFAHEHPQYVFPEFVPPQPEATPYLEAEALAHPLVQGRAVGNSVQLGKTPHENDAQGLRLIIISGPNMAGKSTFTRSVGVNAVLAQAGAPVRARRMALSELQVAASICVLDSLQGGLSRFYAEITRLKLIYDLTAKNLPVLFLMDELLSGTNSHDRRVGTESIVRGLLGHRAIGIVTTHDLALTEIVGTLHGQAANYHFGDTFAEGKLSFDYRLSPGIAESTNALELMRSIGLTSD
ncbi:MAG: mismatch repair protein [Silvibacterium sp.]